MKMTHFKLLIFLFTLFTVTHDHVFGFDESPQKIKIILDEINLGGLKPEAFAQTINFQIEVKLRYFEHLRQANGKVSGYNVTFNEMTKPVSASPRFALVAPQKENEVHQLYLAAEIDINELKKILHQVPNPNYSRLEVEVKLRGVIGSRAIVQLNLSMEDVEGLLNSDSESKKLALLGHKNSTTYLRLTR